MRAGYRSIALLFALICTAASAAEPVDSLAKVRSLYIADFGGSRDGGRLQASFVQHLAGGRFRIVSSRDQADAILQGTGQIWIRGYIAINPRTPSSDRQPVFGGYLSISVTNSQGEPLWSWLATPSRTRWTRARHAALIELLRWALTSGQKESSALGYAQYCGETAANSPIPFGSPVE